MGVPKFFRYMSERYPCLSEVVKQYQIPEFDNLYLDMNGIIHMCSHPDDGNPHFRITEEQIFEDVFHYIEVLFRMIRPQKLFFMAIDGVAPRAKMNQQRGRRFRSAKDAEKMEREAQKKGEKLPTEERFDSNCITPGTEFMARLHEQLKYFVVMKLSTDKLWKSCKVILSGHETPGEGEHKIMDYIRYMRAQPGYDPNTRHCLYGLDADLIMLGLCTHEPHFSLLREEVKFGKKSTKRNSVPEDITFFLLHLSLMREYLELEFTPIKNKLKSFDYDFEKIIDDWVLMGFLVGNDFIPNLPNLHIADGALPILYKAYMDILPELDGYINESGTLNLARFENFMQKLSHLDMENFEEVRDDMLYMEAKTGRKCDAHTKVSTGKSDTHDENFFKNENKDGESQNKMDPGLAALIQQTDDMYLHSDEESPISEDEGDESDFDHRGFVNYKKEYYRNKMEFAKVTPEVMRDQAEGYVRAIQWNLNYYYNGVCSWSWYYPHHYAPYISDIKGFSNLKPEFDLGNPFLPYEQLLAVLPSGSMKLLPKAYHDLMVSDDSPIKQYYPEDFQTDLNGKKQEWEAVVLVPFIDENKLLEAMRMCNKQLTDEEKKRNRHGPMLVYTYVPDDLGKYEAPSYFPPIENNHAKRMDLTIDDVRVPKEKLIKGAYPGVKMDVYYPGFPTMKYLKYSGYLKKAKVKVFDQPSRNDNMILKLESNCDNENMPLDLLGKVIYVGWPHLIEAKVAAINNGENRYVYAGENKPYKTEPVHGNMRDIYRQEVNSVYQHHMGRWGIDYGEFKILVQVQVMMGRKYIITPNGRVNMEKQFTRETSNFALKGIVRDITVYNKETGYKDITDIFQTDSVCFVLANPYYGAMGTVLGVEDSRLKLSLEAVEEPDLDFIRDLQERKCQEYNTLYNIAASLSMSGHLFSRITGSLLMIDPGTGSSVNVGLDLKFNKKNMETPGYTKKVDSTWYYTDKAADLVQEYVEKFPDLIDYLCDQPKAYELDPVEVFGDEWRDSLQELRDWIKALPTYNIERRICGSEAIQPDVIKEIENYIDKISPKLTVKKLTMRIKPQYVYNPNIQTGNLMPDNAAELKILDRIVNVREGFTVPLGLKGTIIAIHKPKSTNESDIVYDVVFDKCFAGGLPLSCSEKRGYRLPRTAFINISHGIRQFNNKVGKPALDTTRSRYAQNPQYTNKYTDKKNYQSNQNYNQCPPQQNSAFASFNNEYQRPVFPYILNQGTVNAPQAGRQHGEPYNNQILIPNKTQTLNTEPKSSRGDFMPDFRSKPSTSSQSPSRTDQRPITRSNNRRPQGQWTMMPTAYNTKAKGPEEDLMLNKTAENDKNTNSQGKALEEALKVDKAANALKEALKINEATKVLEKTLDEKEPVKESDHIPEKDSQTLYSKVPNSATLDESCRQTFFDAILRNAQRVETASVPVTTKERNIDVGNAKEQKSPQKSSNFNSNKVTGGRYEKQPPMVRNNRDLVHSAHQPAQSNNARSTNQNRMPVKQNESVDSFEGRAKVNTEYLKALLKINSDTTIIHQPATSAQKKAQHTSSSTAQTTSVQRKSQNPSSSPAQTTSIQRKSDHPSNSPQITIQRKSQHPLSSSAQITSIQRKNQHPSSTPSQPTREENKQIPPTSCLVHLINYYQSNGLGLPRYQFVSIFDGIIAQLTLPSNKLIIGEPASTEEKASENAARAALEALNLNQGATSKPPDSEPTAASFPVPPPKWVHHPSSPAKGPHRDFQQKHMVNNHYFVSRHANAPQGPSVGEIENKNRNLSTDATIFVPLQAIKAVSNKNAPSQNKTVANQEQNVPEKNNPVHEDSSSQGDENKKEKEQEAKNKKAGSKPRHNRKMRIAASFAQTQ